MKRPFVVGITGRSGSGKSTLCGILERAGLVVFDCDRIAREVQGAGGACLAELAGEFSSVILKEDGSLDRKRLADICFSSEDKKKMLNEICHPHILKRLFELIDGCNAGICAVEAGALFESGLDAECDRIVCVVSSDSLSVERIQARDGISGDSAKLRLDAQLSEREITDNSDYVVVNDGTLAMLEQRAGELIKQIRKWEAEGDSMSKDKSKAEILGEAILAKRKSCFELYSEKELDAAKAYAGEYMKFLDSAKTERESVSEGIDRLEKGGFAPFDSKKSYKAGDRVYYNNRGKALVAAVVGSMPVESGVNIIAAHVDSPRLDLKPNPLYEDSGLGLFKTHYYGGIKKYQWTAIPLALHGVVVDRNGKKINVTVGEDIDDPILYISNLLPHLSGSHNTRTGREIIKGEELNALAGSVPFDTEKDTKDAVKLNAMRLINEKYGFCEGDFACAELELVPAYKARFVGLDKGLIAAYGHDDRVCAYPALTALLVSDAPARTGICVFADKEETGSNGSTGLQCEYLRQFIVQLSAAVDKNADPLTVLQNSKALSADVTAALDPTYPEVMEKRNSSYLNYGPSVDKYGGSGGKYGCNDSSAEYVGSIAAMLDNAGVCWQTGELGKVDEGGGGTVAKFIAELNIDVVDCGVPLLSMHSPYEIASVYDVYSFYLCCREFYKN